MRHTCRRFLWGQLVVERARCRMWEFRCDMVTIAPVCDKGYACSGRDLHWFPQKINYMRLACQLVCRLSVEVCDKAVLKYCNYHVLED